MNRIDELFSRKQKDILNIYFTAGYPNLDDTARVIHSLVDNGVDLIEIGMPYSDPLADGPTIQQSGQKAIANGMSLPLLFQQITEARQTTAVPLVLMGYFNQVMQYGEEAFFDHCVEVGIDGLILPDLPIYEFETFYQQMLEERGLKISFLITPQTSEARIRKIDDLSTGFVYMVSDASITGSKTGISEHQVAYFERINAMKLNANRLIGFGISDHSSFSTACQYANGAIIGSAYIRALSNGEDIESSTRHFIQRIKFDKRLTVSSEQ
jgi:tryptophan synthase alpha chain